MITYVYAPQSALSCITEFSGRSTACPIRLLYSAERSFIISERLKVAAQNQRPNQHSHNLRGPARGGPDSPVADQVCWLAQNILRQFILGTCNRVFSFYTGLEQLEKKNHEIGNKSCSPLSSQQSVMSGLEMMIPALSTMVCARAKSDSAATLRASQISAHRDSNSLQQ